MKSVRFLEEALDEFLEQVSFYEEREKGRGTVPPRSASGNHICGHLSQTRFALEASDA